MNNILNTALANQASENLNFLPFLAVLKAQINIGIWQLNNTCVSRGGGYWYKQKHPTTHSLFDFKYLLKAPVPLSIPSLSADGNREYILNLMISLLFHLLPLGFEKFKLSEIRSRIVLLTTDIQCSFTSKSYDMFHLNKALMWLTDFFSFMSPLIPLPYPLLSPRKKTGHDWL